MDERHDFSAFPLIYDITSLTNPEFTPTVEFETDSIYYWRFKSYAEGELIDSSRTFALYMIESIVGDATSDGEINLLDILFLIDYLYGNPLGSAPRPFSAGDANCDGAINLLDILYLIDILYGNSPSLELMHP